MGPEIDDLLGASCGPGRGFTEKERLFTDAKMYAFYQPQASVRILLSGSTLDHPTTHRRLFTEKTWGMRGGPAPWTSCGLEFGLAVCRACQPRKKPADSHRAFLECTPPEIGQRVPPSMLEVHTPAHPSESFRRSTPAESSAASPATEASGEVSLMTCPKRQDGSHVE